MNLSTDRTGPPTRTLPPPLPPKQTNKQVRLVFQNALEYNTSAEHPVRIAAEALAALFEERFEMFYKPYLQQLEEDRVKKARASYVYMYVDIMHAHTHS